MTDIFLHGSLYLRADFHLHTRADSEFPFTEEQNSFITNYIKALQTADIRVGIITNHNKFDRLEFKALKKEAIKHDIYLLPGVEYSLKEGIHCLIVFDESWYEGKDSINEFIDRAFYSIPNRDSPPYPNSLCDLKETVESLDIIGLDYFIILAHVDDDNGLFKVLKGRTLDAFVTGESFNRVLGLQKSGNNKNYQRLCSIIGRNPACLEGTDNAQGGIEAIAAGRRITYLKIGDFNFKAVKYALTDSKNRITQKIIPGRVNSYIKSIHIESSQQGLLHNTTLNLSPELNNLIGIRGSGKSALLEILRYSLEIPLGRQAMDSDYKNELIKYSLKSGGKIIITLINEHNKEYRIEKIYGQKSDIFQGPDLIPASLSAIFKPPVYFGQKDLSNKNIDFEADLINKLIGNRLEEIRNKISQKEGALRSDIINFKTMKNLEEQKKETIIKKMDSEQKLAVYHEKGIQEKLKTQSSYDSDYRKLNEIKTELDTFLSEMRSLINNYHHFFTETTMTSEINRELFTSAHSVFSQLKKEFESIETALIKMESNTEQFSKIIITLENKKDNLKEEFAKIKREINDPTINPDEFLNIKRVIDTSDLKLKEIAKSEKKREELKSIIEEKMKELNDLWYEEFRILDKEVARINKSDNRLAIKIDYKGRKDKFKEKQSQVFRGTGITETNYTKISEKYTDFIEIYKDDSQLKSILNDNHYYNYRNCLLENLDELLTFQVENKFTITYNSKPLKDHSLGQRATALILFLLAQKDTDVLIIDQPEDDLDNQTIYRDVIKEIKALKGNMQFIFATHNPNIPVLGDSEKIFVCTYSPEKIDIQSGSIDTIETQKTIVDIMEGGKEAFEKRVNIYNLWKVIK